MGRKLTWKWFLRTSSSSAERGPAPNASCRLRFAQIIFVQHPGGVTAAHGRGLVMPLEHFSFDFDIHWRLRCRILCVSMYRLKNSGAGIPRQNLNFHLIDRRAPCPDTRAVDGGDFWSNHPSWIMIQYSSSECVCSWGHIRVTQRVVSHSSEVTTAILLEH